MSNISGEGTLNGQIFGVTDVIDYDNLTNRPKINNKTVEGEHNGRYYDLTESEIIDWIDYEALPEETKKNGKIYFIRNVGTYEEKTISNVAVASFNDGSQNPLVSLKIDIDANLNGYSSIDVIVSPTLTPDAGTTTTIDIGQTIFGGKINTTTGEIILNRAIIDLGSINWSYNSGGQVFGSNQFIPRVKTNGNLLCDQYGWNSTPNITPSSMSDGQISASPFFNINTVMIKDLRYTDAPTFKAAVNGIRLCYELATPTTIYIAPTRIDSLNGTNNIWANSGDINEVKYLSPTGATENQIRTNDEIFARA